MSSLNTTSIGNPGCMSGTTLSSIRQRIFVRKLRQNPLTANTPIIFVTGLDAEALDPLPDLSAVLRKPCHQGEILNAIRNVLGGSA